MKTIKLGTPPDGGETWMYEVEITCPVCGTVYQVESTNDFRPFAKGKRAVITHCPLCDERVLINNPYPPRKPSYVAVGLPVPAQAGGNDNGNATVPPVDIPPVDTPPVTSPSSPPTPPSQGGGHTPPKP